MMANPAGVAHARGGDNHLGRGVHVQRLGLLAGLRHPEVGKVKHMGAVLHQLQGILIQIAVKVSGEDGGSPFGQGRVNVHGEIWIGFYELRVLDLPDEIQQLLGAAHGEGGNHYVAAPGDGLVNNLRQIVRVAPHLGVISVSIGGLHYHIVRALDGGWVPDDGLVDVAQIAGEHQPLRRAVLHGVHDDAGTAQQVSGVHKAGRHALA